MRSNCLPPPEKDTAFLREFYTNPNDDGPWHGNRAPQVSASPIEAIWVATLGAFARRIKTLQG